VLAGGAAALELASLHGAGRPLRDAHMDLPASAATGNGVMLPIYRPSRMPRFWIQ